MDKEANNTTTVNCHDAMRRRSCSSAFTVACAARSAGVRSAPSLETPAMGSARSWVRRAARFCVEPVALGGALFEPGADHGLSFAVGRSDCVERNPSDGIGP
jgi:hypothetical protein